VLDAKGIICPDPDGSGNVAIDRNMDAERLARVDAFLEEIGVRKKRRESGADAVLPAAETDRIAAERLTRENRRPIRKNRRLRKKRA
jgi:hypothetical protein